MKNDEAKARELRVILNEIERRNAKNDLLSFTKWAKKDYSVNWHHALIADKLTKFAKGEIKRLMIFMPPQHGKSELVSRRLPAYMLGLDPSLKIIGASYSATLAKKFNKDAKRIIDSSEYRQLFPDTAIAGSKLHDLYDKDAENWQGYFDVIGHEGYYYSVGFDGTVSGYACDVMIIDDPVKNRQEAESELKRERIFDAYTSVLKQRMHNDSRELLTMTRYHEDDLAGRLLKFMEEDEEGIADEWEVVNLPAVLESEDDRMDGDERKIGEALWEEKHGVKKHMMVKKVSLRDYNSILQQKPSAPEGDIIKADKWFEIVEYYQMVEHALRVDAEIVPMGFIDGAYTEKVTNDPSAVLTGVKIQNTTYILDVTSVRKKFPDFIRFIKEYLKRMEYKRGKSVVYAEPKATGISVVQQLAEEVEINVTHKVSDFMNMKDGKIGRAEAVTIHMATDRVKLIKGNWNRGFMDQCKAFPNTKHDDEVDVLVMCLSKFYGVDVSGGDKLSGSGVG